MKAYELFRLLSSAELDALVLAACQDEDVPDKIAGGVITYRAVPLRRFAKLPEETRKAYVRRTLRDKRAADLSLFVLSAGLTRGHAKLIETFLEALSLEHDGPNLSVEGAIPEPAAEKLTAAIDRLVAEFPPREVALYLHAFASQGDVSWASLSMRLSSDERLALADRSGD